MMIGEFVQKTLKEIDEQLDSLYRQLQEGRCVDFTAYKFTCGQVRGLALARDVIIDLAKKAHQHDDDDTS
jgi:hypothetical protein